MAFITFCGFDSARQGTISNNSDTSPVAWNGVRMCIPPGFYTYAGFATLDRTAACANSGPSSTSQSMRGRCPVFTARCGSLGWNTTGSLTSTTRTNFINAKGFQFGLNRSEWSVGGEIWMTMDICHPGAPSVLASSYSPTSDFLQIFRWGDVEIRLKEITASHVYVLSIRNNGAEIATVSATLNSAVAATGAGWGFIKIHVKLHNTTGLIEVEFDGNAQSAAYTGQNTVATTSLAAATGIFFGPIVADNGTTAYAGSVDNVYFDDAAFPAGRPVSWAVTLHAGTSGGSGWAAAGTASTPTDGAGAANFPSPATVADSKSLRGTNSGSEYYLGIPLLAGGTAGLASVIGVQVHALGVHKRSGANDNRFTLGLSTSGATDLHPTANATPLNAEAVAAPPASSIIGKDFFSQHLTRPGGGAFALTDIETNGILRAHLKVATP